MVSLSFNIPNIISNPELLNPLIEVTVRLPKAPDFTLRYFSSGTWEDGQILP